MYNREREEARQPWKNAEDRPQIVYTVYCVGSDDFDVAVHIFSTAEKAIAFAKKGERTHVISDYVIDHPERLEQALK